MSGIRRRNRPRVRSFNLRRLRWLLVREAAYQIIQNTHRWDVCDLPLRTALARSSTDRVVRRAEHLLAIVPTARHSR